MQALGSSSRCAFSSARPAMAARPVFSRSAVVTVEAACPKKKTSKSKTKIRSAAWKKEVNPYVTRALFVAKLAQKAGARDSADKDMSLVPAAPAADTPAESQ